MFSQIGQASNPARVLSLHTTLISFFTAMAARPAPLGITADFAALADLFAAARFTDATRLYAFASDGLPELLVESFCGIETVCGAGAGAQWVVDVLSDRKSVV